MSVAGVSAARLTIAELDLRSVDVQFGPLGVEGGMIRTFSTVSRDGINALMTAGDVPGGRLDRWSVGFGVALVSSSSPLKADSAPLKSLLASRSIVLVREQAMVTINISPITRKVVEWPLPTKGWL